MKASDISDPLFRKAVEALDSGDISALQILLEANPDLVTRRLDTPNDRGYFKNPYLLWFVADNPIRTEQLPANILDLTKEIIASLRQRPADYQQQLDYALGLVSTGRIPRESGVQIPLMELLIDSGAAVKGSVLGPIGQRNFEAARYLLGRGGHYDLATAVALDELDAAKTLAENATPSELYVALVVASFFGRTAAISLLLDAGADVNGDGQPEDFGGFHSHASPLHQAVFSGSLSSVRLLVDAGADLAAIDKAYHGTPLGWATHLQEGRDIKLEHYQAIAGYLAGKTKS